MIFHGILDQKERPPLLPFWSGAEVPGFCPLFVMACVAKKSRSLKYNPFIVMISLTA